DITPKYSGPVWWVSTRGSDSNEGSSGGPFKTIEYALEQVTAGDTVMLKSGTYSGSGNHEIEISSINTAINFDNYKNLVITSEKGADSTIIDAENNGRHFSIIGNQSNTIDSTLQFIGLTFIGGQRSDYGGSFYIEGSTYWDNSSQKNIASQMQPKFKNCVFKDNEAFQNNEAGRGGALFVQNAAPIFESCVFDSNYSNGHGGAIQFGGDNMAQIDTVWFRSCTFNQNRVDDASQTQNNPKSAFGGAIALNFGMNLIIINSTFSNNEVEKNNNSSQASGGAIGIERDWSSTISPYVKIYNSRFTNNNATHNVDNGGGAARGGAIYAGAPIVMMNSVVDNNSINAVNGSNGNTAGGGLYISIQSHQNINPVLYGYSYLINNTIVDNYAGTSDQNDAKAAGIFIDNPDQMRGTWFNNIIWGNRSNGLEDRQNLNRIDENQFTLLTDYNNVEDSENYSYIMGPNSVDIEPAFYSATNYQLSAGSPLIGAGISSYDGHSAPIKDILGNDRPNPSGSSPDLGAYENSLAESPYPKKIQNLVGKPEGGQVSLSWDAGTETDLAKYYVYMSTTMDFTPTSIDSVGETTETNYTVTGLANKTEYHFTVAAVDSGGYRGAFAKQVSVMPQYSGPNWYVAVDGSNENDGDENNPFSDLRMAVDSAKSGHTVILMPGTHSGPENREINLSDGNEIRIMGDPNSNVEDIILDAEFNGRHFNILGDYDSTLVFKNITFKRGSGQSDGGSWRLAGSIRIEGGSYWDEQQQQQVEGYPSPKFIGCVWEDNHVGGDGELGAGGAIALRDVSPIFVGCTFENNSAGTRGGAIYTQSFDSNYPSSPVFRYCLFKSNRVYSQNEGVVGGAVMLEDAGKPLFVDTRFESNTARSENSDAEGGAVGLWGQREELESDIVFSRCVFVLNQVESQSGSGKGGAVIASTPFTMVNTIVVKNSVVSGNWGNGGGLKIDSQANSILINNTIADNTVSDNSGNPAYEGGGIYAWGTEQSGLWFNNIIFGNNSDMGKSIQVEGTNNIDMAYLNVDDEVGKPWFDASTMITDKPKFRNPTSDDYRLSFNSALVDAGVASYGGENAPKVDTRNYYRIGTPDIGALEAGASKYLLAMTDDIEADEDTTFVKLSQELTITVTTGDIEGNLVSSN
ncbi:MAG: DUF1565 domain-containing protein, partial [Candidatus Marinimicrobia bacterium]|nr:DUF1565 domain-containing protein [Candidatus Neomarinimicrobiota bacterium]